jgi:hypothetical protein
MYNVRLLPSSFINYLWLMVLGLDCYLTTLNSVSVFFYFRLMSLALRVSLSALGSREKGMTRSDWIGVVNLIF